MKRYLLFLTLILTGAGADSFAEGAAKAPAASPSGNVAAGNMAARVLGMAMSDGKALAIVESLTDGWVRGRRDRRARPGRCSGPSSR